VEAGAPRSAEAAPTQDAGTAPDAAVATETGSAPVPELFGADGGVLEQTEQLPSADSPSLRARTELLFRAIVENQPKLALPAFFPRVAYSQVKAVVDADRDYDRRLITAFERDIGEHHRALGGDAKSAELVGLEIPSKAAKWMKPGSEGNRLPYHRVLRSKLLYKVGDKTRELVVTSLISWRGEWYVVHLNGFD
jgi:hypothetical protein